jgi:GntR family transcriptional regulator
MKHVKHAASRSGVPLHRQVRDGIEQLIAKRPRSPPSLSDMQLAEHFGVSRITVRRAVAELVDAGVLYRVRGLGTFVRPHRLNEKLTLNSFLDTWVRKAGHFDVQVAAFERVPADADVARRLGVEEGAEAVFVRRLRYEKKVLVAVDDRYLRTEFCTRLRRQDIVTASLVDYLRNREDIDLSRGEMEIEARRATRADAKMLEISRGQTVLVRRVIFFTNTGTAALAGASVYRADRVTYRLAVSS